MKEKLIFNKKFYTNAELKKRISDLEKDNIKLETELNSHMLLTLELSIKLEKLATMLPDLNVSDIVITKEDVQRRIQFMAETMKNDNK